MEKIICRRTPSGPVVEGVDYRWRYHSTEFNWGYGGSGRESENHTEKRATV